MKIQVLRATEVTERPRRKGKAEHIRFRSTQRTETKLRVKETQMMTAFHPNDIGLLSFGNEIICARDI